MKSIAENYTLEYDEWEDLLHRWVFSEMARGMLRRHLYDAVSIETIAEEFDRSATYTQKVLSKWKKELIKHIPDTKLK